jgi:hypothetical protein
MAAAYPRGNLFIPGPAGRIECILRRKEGVSRWAVVSHPDPKGGGTMHNKVVYRAGRALEEAGLNVLRYNFRGVGSSEGTHDMGRGEAEDLRAAIAHVEEEGGGRDIILAGFSFGSWVNARVGCADPRVAALLHIGLPVSTIDLDFLWSCPKPTAVVQGDLDEYGAWEKVVAVAESMPDSRIFRIEGAGHFFEGRIAELDRALAEAIRWLDR